MLRSRACVLAVAFALSLAAPAFAAPAEQQITHKRVVPNKHRVARRWHGYGFLPGYPPSAADERERWQHYDRLYGSQYYGPAWPGFYRGRWNGGGFGPCWTQTPIGPMWNCGR